MIAAAWSHARAVARAAAFLAWTSGLGGAWLIARAFLPKRARPRGAARVLSLWSRGLCALLGVRVRVAGTPPRGPRLLVSNHVGYLDVIVLAAARPALFVSKADLAEWPLLGALARSVKTVFLERGRPRAVAEAGAAMEALFESGVSVIVFPEGTTTRGETVQPLRAALLEPALRAGVPVRGAFLRYAPRDARDPSGLAAWVGDDAFVPHLYRLFRSRGLEAGVEFRGEDCAARERRGAAEELRAWMLEALGKVPEHGLGDGGHLVRRGAHGIRGARHGHRAARAAQQR